jgi:hypothetical protein
MPLSRVTAASFPSMFFFEIQLTGWHGGSSLAQLNPLIVNIL